MSSEISPQRAADSATCGIQEAIDALGPAGGVVAIPAGRFVIRRGIRLPDRVTLRGQGPATVLTRQATVFVELTRDADASDLVLRLPTVDGFAPGDQLRIMDDQQPMYHSREAVVTAIDADGVRYALLSGDPQRVYRVADHAWVGNLFPAVVASGAQDVSVESLTIDGGESELREDRSGDFLGAAVHFLKCHNVRLRDITIRRWPADGISVQGGSASVTGCVVEGCLGSGLHPGSALERSVWIGNTARGNRDGFFFCSTVRNTICAHNVLVENRRHGIWGLGDPDMGNVVVGNVCALNGGHGLEAGRAWGNLVAANLLRANSQSQPGAFCAMLLHDHRHNLVIANLCLDDQPQPTQMVGIRSEQPRGENDIDHNPRLAVSPP
jgi:hypothetical protein